MRSVLKKIIVFLLTWEARATVRKYKPNIIAITGSVGKTSTKDAIYSVVASTAHARKSQKSFNSEVGLPLTILGRPNAWQNPLQWFGNLLDGLFLILFTSRYPQWLVLEIGADRPGDISSLSSWLPVDIAVITRLPDVPVHVEFFDSPEAVVEEKASLIKTLKDHGTLVLYGDDRVVRNLEMRAPGKKIVTFGLGSDCDVRAEEFSVLFEEGKEEWPLGMRAKLSLMGTSAPLEVMGALGAHALLPLVAAAAVGQVLGRPIDQIITSLRNYVPPPGRMRLLRGIKNSIVIDDTYNSSPAATVAALDSLVLLPKKSRKIAVLGDMLELGRHSVDEHRKLGAHTASRAQMLVTVGFRARDIAQGALDAGMPESAIFQYEHADKAGQELQNMTEEGDSVLVKGSQSMRMERVVEDIMLEPERAEELLVRQDAEWKKR